MLRSLCALQMFRRIAGPMVSGPATLRFLLRDLQFPRSVERCLVEISRALLELAGHDEPMAGCAEVQQLLEGADLGSLGADGPSRLPCTTTPTVCSRASASCTNCSSLLTSRWSRSYRSRPVLMPRMSIRVALEHHMSYRFDRPVRLSPHVVRLRPAPHCRTPILAYSLRVAPERPLHQLAAGPFGNHLARLVFPEPARELTVTVDLVADLRVINPFDFFVDETAERYPFAYDAALCRVTWRRTSPSTKPSPLLASGPTIGWRFVIAAGPMGGASSTSWSRSTSGSQARWPTPSAWSPACRPPTRRWKKGSGRAGTARGCSCRSCAGSGSPPGSCRVTWCSCAPTRSPWTGRRARRRFHRSPRLGRGVPARGWLDRPRPHLGPVGRGGPPPPGLLAAPGVRRPDLRGDRPVRGDLRVLQHGAPLAGRPV